jgi:hypothetical protein
MLAEYLHAFHRVLHVALVSNTQNCLAVVNSQREGQPLGKTVDLPGSLHAVTTCSSLHLVLC